ncbi:hypothetical protein [Coraliomargarita parva]|uniref:hypothetical protein n=1 Tax=Coraliomargarita parva TaxID=3014050 RepID=UPI0022B3B0E4|nr:hypothetical protein [Coraliomargarita parva]
MIRLAQRMYGLGLLSGAVLCAQEPYTQFESKEINESSGIVKSKTWPDVYWTHNDSLDAARIFAVDSEGRTILPDWFEWEYKGLQILDAVNADWEDIAVDDAGNLAIGAFGNNGNARRDLAIYLLREPNPRAVVNTRIAKQIRFRYPDQSEYPPLDMNFDAEALFYAYGHYHILSKHRSNRSTKLYRFDSMNPIEENVLTLTEHFEIDGMVTAADFDAEKELLAVLTYNSLWLFETKQGELLGGPHHRILLEGTKQAEAVCFDGDTLIVTNEQAELFRFEIEAILAAPPVTEKQVTGWQALIRSTRNQLGI